MNARVAQIPEAGFDAVERLEFPVYLVALDAKWILSSPDARDWEIRQDPTDSQGVVGVDQRRFGGVCVHSLRPRLGDLIEVLIEVADSVRFHLCVVNARLWGYILLKDSSPLSMVYILSLDRNAKSEAAQ